MLARQPIISLAARCFGEKSDSIKNSQLLDGEFVELTEKLIAQPNMKSSEFFGRRNEKLLQELKGKLAQYCNRIAIVAQIKALQLVEQPSLSPVQVKELRSCRQRLDAYGDHGNSTQQDCIKLIDDCLHKFAPDQFNSKVTLTK